MMAVSCAKSMLVILFFMHVKYEANWKYVLTIPAAMMSIFLMMMLVPDVGMRMRNPTGGPPGVAQEQVMHLRGNPRHGRRVARPTKTTPSTDAPPLRPAGPCAGRCCAARPAR